MERSKRKQFTIFLLLFVLISTSQLFAQVDYVIIGDIVISGHRKTKEKIILRELNFEVGDTILISNLAAQIERNKDQLMNISLFTNVRINLLSWEPPDPITIVDIQVNEGWYIFPFPVVKLVDRNFNVWWNDFNHDFNRLYYGFKLYHINLTGRNDYLKVVNLAGFSRNHEVKYRLPYINKSQTMGMEWRALYTKARQSDFRTFKDKVEFVDIEDNDKIFRTKFLLSTGISFRPKIKLVHKLKLIYERNMINDTIQELNPNYFMNDNNIQRAFTFSYKGKYAELDHVKQPTRGFSASLEFIKAGFGIFNDVDYTFVEGTVQKFTGLTDRLYLRNGLRVRKFLSKNRVPYTHSKALGYNNNFIRAYEPYVVDGTDFTLFKNGLVLQFFNQTLPFSKMVPLKFAKDFSLRMFISFNFDLGYVNSPEYGHNNTLNDQWIYGFGPSLELLLMENLLLSIDYSVNDRLEDGFFLHSKFNF